MTILRAAALSILLGLGAFLPLSLPADVPPPPGVPPRVPPEEAKKTFQVAKGLEIQLVAHEPMVRQPVCITFDDRGRLWVLQYLQYPIPNGLKAGGGGPVPPHQVRPGARAAARRARRGPTGSSSSKTPTATAATARRRTFVTGLNLASGMALGYGGVFVVQPPYLLFYRRQGPATDEPDGDPEVLLKGFGMEDAHAFANSLTWGPDGWLYGAQGSTVTANIRGIEFQQGIWRYHPRDARSSSCSPRGAATPGASTSTATASSSPAATPPSRSATTSRAAITSRASASTARCTTPTPSATSTPSSTTASSAAR